MPPSNQGVVRVRRRREDVRTERRPCVVCGDERDSVLYLSWQPAGRLSRRRLDERLRWRCLACGTRTLASVQDRGQTGRHHV